jgi:hypothetical protein
MRPRTALIVLVIAALLDIACGFLYSAAEPRTSAGLGLYCALGNATTDGVCTAPVTVAGHWINAAEFALVVPLFGAAFSLFTGLLTAEHVKRKVLPHTDATRRMMADLYHHHTGKRHPDAPQPRELTDDLEPVSPRPDQS